jgi:hypothetical protein
MRLLKQFLYGIFFLAIIGGVAYGVYFLTLRPTPSCFDNQQNGEETGVDCGGPLCISCEEKNLRPLSLLPTVLFRADRSFSASAEVRNPNTHFGARMFDYEVYFYDASGNVLRSASGKSFIYPGESKYIVDAGARITAGIPSRAEIKLKENSVQWVREDEFLQPLYDVKNVATAIEAEQVIVSGTISNLNNFSIARIIIDAFLVDRFSAKVGVSKTELNNVGPFRVEQFKIFFPITREMREVVDAEATSKTVIVEVLK